MVCKRLPTVAGVGFALIASSTYFDHLLGEHFMYFPLFVVTYFFDAKTSIGLFRERESLPLPRPNMNQVVPASTPQTARLTVVSISAEERVKSQKGPRHGI